MPENASPEPVLIVGAVTWDVVGDERRAGGAATFAARVATALGVRAHVLVLAGPDASLDAFSSHECTVVPVARTLTLEHRFVEGERHQRVLVGPERALTPGDLPAGWPAAYRTIVLAPLLPDDIDVPAFLDACAAGPEVEVALLAQGLGRQVAADGAITDPASPSQVFFDVARPNVTLFLSAEETAGWAPGDLDALVARSKRVVRTFGRDGAEIRTAAGVHAIEALPATLVDATGAGDVFATALILAMRAGDEVAGRLAAACAAACVERIGSAPLPARTELETRAGIAASERSRAQGDRT